MADENNIEQKIKLTYETNADQTGKEVNALAGAVDNVTDSQQANDAQTKKTNEGLKTFKSQLREANQELMKQAQLYGETSKEAVTAAKKVADLKDQMQFSKDLVDNFNPDQKFKALGAATQIAATATSGLVSGMALFGDQSEQTEKALLKVQAAMAFSDAISGLSNLGDQWKTLKTVIASSTIVTAANTAATTVSAGVMGLFGGAVDATAVSFKLLKGAIIATGIGALVIGLVAIYQNFDAIKKVVFNLVPGLEGVADGVMDIVNAVTDFIGVTSEAGRAQDRLKANADASLALNKKFLSEHESQLDEFTKQKIEAKNKYSEAVKEDGANQVALAQELNRKLAAIEYSRGDESRKIAQQNAEKAAAEEKARREKAAEDAKKAADDKLKAERQAMYDANQDFIQVQADIKADSDERKEEQAAKDEEEGKNKMDQIVFDAEKQIEIDKYVLEQKKANQSGLMSVAEQGISLLKGIFGKSKAVQKAAIIAENAIGIGKTVINTMTGNAAALAQGIVQAGPIIGPGIAAPAIALNTISGGISVAGSIAATAKALQAVGGGSAGGASIPNSPRGSGGSTSAAPQVSFQASSENQIANTISQSQNTMPKVEAFVVESSMTKAQDLSKKKIVANSF